MIYIQERETQSLPGVTSLFISFDYSPVLVNYFKQLNNKFYHPESKEWEISLNQLNNVIEKFYYYEIQVDLINYKELQEIKLPKDFKFKTKPFEHQIEGVNYGLNHKSYILGDDQGLGKTKQIIDLALYLKEYQNLEHCLIICGVNGLKYNWLEEIETHSDLSARIIGLKRRIKSKKVYSASVQERAEELLNEIKEFFIIINIESFRDSTLKTQAKTKDKKTKKVKRENIIVSAIKNSVNNFGMCAIDEAHKVKNAQSSQGSNLLELKNHFKYKIPMSGTILLNSPLDAFVPLTFIGAETRTYQQFKNFYCEYDRWSRGQVIGYQNLNILQEQLSSVMLRRKKTEVLDLPPKLWKLEYVEMSDRQQIVYNEVVSSMLENIDRIRFSPNPLNEFIRLRQATGNTAILSSTIQESVKYERLDDLVEDLISENRKVVIVSNWRQILDPLEERYTKYGVVTYTGDVSLEDRQLNKNKFQTDPECRVFLGLMSAMGVGLTLTAADTIIFLDSPWTKGECEQVSDRLHRIGTTQNVTCIKLICKGTIDEKVEEIVSGKALITDYLIEGFIPIEKKDSLVNYLLDL